MERPTLEQTRIELVGVQSMLRMLEGNTDPDDIRRLEKVWLSPILSRLMAMDSEHHATPQDQ